MACSRFCAVAAAVADSSAAMYAFSAGTLLVP